MRIAAGVISLLLGFGVLFQSCAVSGLGAIVAPDSAAGAIGMLVGILLLMAGAFAFQLPRVAMVISIICAGLAFIEASNDFADMNVWAVICLCLAVMEFFAGRKPRTSVTTVP